MTNGLCHVRVASILMLTAITGCTSWLGGGGSALQPDKYENPNPAGTVRSRHEVVDEVNPMYDQVRVLEMDPTRPETAKLDIRPKMSGGKPAPRESVSSVSNASQEMARRQPTAVAGATPSTLPAKFNPNPGVTTVGSVVTTVNGAPIYADRVLGKLAPALSAEARQRDADSFRSFAADVIAKQVRTEVQNELVYAQAEKTIDSKEKELAGALTEDWQRKEIIRHGGSEEEMRASYARQGQEFDDVINDKYREFVVAIYYQKRIFPKVQVTADDMRRYYDRNKDKLYTETEQATFRLIKFDPKKVGSKEEALKRANEVLAKAKAGDDFQLLASQFNNDERLQRSAGLEQPIRKGDYANTKVEDAVFATPVGQVTNVVDSGNAFYIAKVEQRSEGRIRPFEDQAVQADIRDILRKQQMAPMIDRAQARLLADAIINPDPPRITAVMEMAMQKYGEWKGS